MVRKKVSSKKSLIKKNSANKVVSRKKSHKSSVKKVLPRHELHPLPKWLEVIEHINANKASQPWHYGRKRRSRMKRTHIQIVLKEDKKW